ncbi:MAG: hypothetical protein LJE93_07120 [Acidobacteria bacterium]|nr:hypothetical protein [Acidobacteriota bacterium]
MKTALVAAAASVLIVLVTLILGHLLRRIRLARRLERAEGRVEEAMADGRLAAATGEALMQHLDGLRRACVWRGER